MNLSAIAIQRPVFTTMVMGAVLVLGAMGFGRLGTDLFPDVTFPMVVVGVVYPGASPSEVENLISRPVEDAVFGLNGIDSVRSFSRDGFSQTWVIFQLGVDLDNAANLVRERVAQIRSRLPEDARDPAVARLDVSAAPIVIYTLGGARSLSEARKFADEVIKPALEQLSGVQRAELVFNQFGPGDFFGEMALIDHGPRSAAAITVTAADMLLLKHEHFLNVHFGYLHTQQTKTMRTRDIVTEGPVFTHRTYQVYNLFRLAKRWISSEVAGPLDITCYGLGCVVNRALVEARIRLEYTFVFFATPIDEEHIEVNSAA